MKTKLLISALVLLSPFAFLLSPCTAQVPMGFNYQAIARDGSGAIIANTALPVKITIQTSTGTVIYEELFSSVVTNQFGLISLVVGTGTWQSGLAVTFSAIDWKAQTLYLKTTIQYPGTTWTTMGTSQLWGVPYSLVAKDVAGPLSKLGITGTTDVMDEALFEVKNKKGNTVFAVYNEGIRAYVGDGSAKGVKGGFSVGGYDATKSDTVRNIFVLSTDSARFYLDSKPKTTKSVKGGFSVGGYDMTKGGTTVQNYLNVTPDSTRILTKDPNAGFAVQDLSDNGSNYLHIKPENMFIGKDAGEMTVGLYNSFFGYKSGLNNNTGANNVFIGYQSGLTNTLGGSNIFIGPQTGYQNTQGAYNVFIGHNSGYSNETGHDNVFVGQRSGYTNFSGAANLFVGQSSGENNYVGTQNVFLGYESGMQNINGNSNVYLGTQAGFKDSIGNYNVFLGYRAGFYEKESNKLYIDNSGAGKTDALIYGDFNSKELRLNAKVGINSDNSGYLLNVAGDINFNGQLYQNTVPYNPGMVKAQLTENLSSPLPYTNPPVGLLVYNSGTKQPQGFYYWDGNRWLRLLASAAPSIVCQSVTNILGTTATVNANISDDGGTSVAARGICWNTTTNPTIDGTHSLDGTGTGSFLHNLTGLTNNTDYHVRAYAQNQAGIAYSNDVLFNTGNPITLPVLSTAVTTNVTGTTATSGGTITSDGGASVTARGVCWNTSGTPTTSDSKTSNGNGTGSFTSNLNPLSEGGTYHVRAYATNTIGTAYGDEKTFTTPIKPTVFTNSATSITTTSAISGGNITNAGGGEITQRGVCWSTSVNPTTSNSKSNDGTGAGTFTSSITGLTSSTVYHIRAYAINGAGTSYGDDIVFTTVLVLGDSYEGGKIAYFLQSGDAGYDPNISHGLIVALSDQSTGIYWSPTNPGSASGLPLPANSMAIGTGKTNTDAIVASLGSGSYAAKLCYDLVLNGYQDWYLPSYSELHAIYLNRAAIGGFAATQYWTSSPCFNPAPFGGWELDFTSGSLIKGYWNTLYYVRAVRSF